MKPIKHALWMALLLSACGGNPFLPDGVDTGNGPPGTSGDVGKADKPIERRETRTNSGNGYAVGIKLNKGGDLVDPSDDTFEVDGLAFDGGNIYQPGASVSELNTFQVYEGDSTYQDAVTGNNIDQLLYRAIYGASASGKTEFAIVRTGSYVGYGFGGFVYKRNGGVTLPATGTNTIAGYSGRYAGLRDFDGSPGLEYVTGDMTMAIDFDDFNDGAGVEGSITGREIYDIDGLPITDAVITAINDEYGTNFLAMPTLNFTISNSLKASGEASGTISSQAATGTTPFEKGTFYAIVSDVDSTPTGQAGEVVGVIVVTSSDPRPEFDGVTTRETGGFILLRQ